MKNIVIIGHIGHNSTTTALSALSAVNSNVIVIEPESIELQEMVKERGINFVKKEMPILKLTNPYEGLQQHFEPHHYNNRKGRRLKNKKK